MKILFPAFHLCSGGAERTISYLTKYLAARGHEVYVLTWLDRKFYDIDPSVKYISLKCYSINNEKKSVSCFIKKCCNYVKIRIYFPMLIKKIHPNVVFCMLADIAGYFTKMHEKNKFVMIASERCNPNFEDINVVENRKRIFEECEGIVFQTERAKKCYSESIQNKAIVIENAVGNVDVYKINEVTNRRKVICSVGRLVDQKGYDVLLKAFCEVSERHSDYILEIYGEGPSKNKLQDMARQLKIADKVIFMGARKDVIQKIADATCFCLSSVAEGMPNALMEAMAVGLPCVSTDCPFGPAELIKNGENGLLVDIGDYKKMSECICRFIEDDEFATRCGNKAKEIKVTNSIEKKAEEYNKFILQVVKKCNNCQAGDIDSYVCRNR